MAPPIKGRKFDRLTVTYTGTASLSLISVFNRDSGANIFNGDVSEIQDLFERLGFDTVFNYSATP